ncbi:MAG: hypothetical protein M1821_004403 [Bathelium mastoideum]|nr:MAG: hypothetical protein M1821_004403 [Bathelium mastoideum]
MPPFIDQAHLYSVLQHEALPTLEQIAANDAVRDRMLNRFERDEPPPYVSSTESGEIDGDLPALRSDGQLPDELTTIMSPGLTDKEISQLASDMPFIVSPADSYRRESDYEEQRLRAYRPFHMHPLFWGKYGCRRADVLMHHYIKRRWEKLGIWNPEWGIPVRKEQSNDDIDWWKWRWEQDDTDATGSIGSEATIIHNKRKLLVQRALRLRQNLLRGESGPVIPRSHLTPDATASEAESFIISRPWFIYEVELAEEGLRFSRLAPKYRHSFEHSAVRKVNEWWKERGDWREKFNISHRHTLVSAWKWRHETPSPEPEDLTPIVDIKDSVRDFEDLDFTPSEIDAFEAIPPPGYRSPPPPTPPEGRPTLPPSEFDNYFASKEPSPSGDGQDASQEIEERVLEAQRNPSSVAPRKKGRQLRDMRRDTGQDQHQDQAPPLRRSARIAGMKRSAKSLPSEPAPNKKLKSKAIQTAVETRGRTKTRSSPANPAAKKKTESQPSRGGRRTRKENQRKQGRPTKENRRNTTVAKETPAPTTRRGGRTGRGRKPGKSE